MPTHKRSFLEKANMAEVRTSHSMAATSVYRCFCGACRGRREIRMPWRDGVCRWAGIGAERMTTVSVWFMHQQEEQSPGDVRSPGSWFSEKGAQHLLGWAEVLSLFSRPPLLGTQHTKRKRKRSHRSLGVPTAHSSQS